MSERGRGGEGARSGESRRSRARLGRPRSPLPSRGKNRNAPCPALPPLPSLHPQVATWPVVAASLLISAIGLALPYTPVGRVEGMVQLPRSFYGWVAATIAGERLALWRLGAQPVSGAACPSVRGGMPFRLPTCGACSASGCCPPSAAGYAVTVQLAKLLYIRRFRSWL